MNASEQRSFVERFGGIYEHSPWVAERAAEVLDANASLEEIRRVMADCVDNAGQDRQLELIRAHPDLAGKAALAGELTESSTGEQSSAGLDQCTEAEYERFHTLNEQYKRKFGFPFIMAVRNSNRHEILAAFGERVNNSPELEFETALMNIHRIAELRLEALES